MSSVTGALQFPHALLVLLFKGCSFSLLGEDGVGAMSRRAAGAITRVAGAADGSGSGGASHAAVFLAGGTPDRGQAPAGRRGFGMHSCEDWHALGRGWVAMLSISVHIITVERRRSSRRKHTHTPPTNTQI